MLSKPQKSLDDSTKKFNIEITWKDQLAAKLMI